MCNEELIADDFPTQINSEVEEDTMKEISKLRKDRFDLYPENKLLRNENQLLSQKLVESSNRHWFSVENLKLKSDKKLFKFYTGLASYETFKAIFDSFGPAVDNLVYHSSRTNGANIHTPDYVKRGPKRLLSPETEFFIVLVSLRLGLLEVDIANRVSLSISHVSHQERTVDISSILSLYLELIALMNLHF